MCKWSLRALVFSALVVLSGCVDEVTIDKQIIQEAQRCVDKGLVAEHLLSTAGARFVKCTEQYRLLKPDVMVDME